MNNEQEKREVATKQNGDGSHEALPAASAEEQQQDLQGVVARADYDRVVAERDTLLDRLARLQAEFENYRKRSAREQAEFKDYAVSDAVKSFLPILDSFDLALRQKPDASETSLRAGIELIRKQFEDAFTRLGVQTVPSEGQTFDPRVHEAIEMIPSSEHADHEVIEELQRGYKLKDRLLRPAMVRVATNPEKK